MIIIHEDGRIRQVMTTYPEGYAKSLAESGLSWVGLPKTGEDVFARWYVEDGRMMQRQPSGVNPSYAMEVGEVVSFPDLPAFVVRFEDQTVKGEAGEFALAAQAPGVYELSIDCWPMLDSTTTITVTGSIPDTTEANEGMIKLRSSPAVLLERLKQAKDARQASFLFEGVQYQADPGSLSAVLARAGVCEPTDTVRWISAGNTEITLQGEQFINLARSMAGHVDGVMSEFAAKSKQIEAGLLVDPDKWEID